ncbi:hypothetical protein B0H21DRAFT_694636 [Amylocystis lapponica]|nr:hypothetical protein B0H21DRAFT_694636 [Amylocystis lapponica]
MQAAPLPTPVQYDLPEPHRRHSRSHSHRSHRLSATPAVQNPSSASAPPPAGYAGGPTPAPAVRYLRTLTLLIDDLRNGESQLAEVRVPLKAPDNPEDGFWADAKEVCSELQASPSRIDGEAKVYAMRGKFKQYFMRVSSEGDIESMSANLKVSKERTLEVFVEDVCFVPRQILIGILTDAGIEPATGWSCD